MKAAVLREVKGPLVVTDMPKPEISPDEVLVETRTCGICRTDVHIQDGLAYVPSLPHIPGHEPAGVVVEVGSRVTSLRPGQRVAPHLFLTCGTCRYCRAGRDAQCDHVRGILGVTTSGGFAEYFKAPAENLLPLPDNVPFEIGGLTSCAVVTAVHAYRRARLQVGDTVVVLGIGGIGQILVQILRHAGARVIAIGRLPASLELAERAGASLALSADTPDLEERVASFSENTGAACVFECVGLSSTMRTAATLLMRGGQIIVIGEEPEFPAIDTIQIAQRELEILGSRNGSRNDAADALNWMAQGVIKPPIARILSLAQINEGLQLVRDGAVVGRVVIALK
jgi:D-arabinose 1-dehydrogenase-like Zn-dependent alcohol dehydrogenase